MPRKQADIQGAMLNVEQQINFALDQNNKFTNDLNNNVLGLLAREDAMLAQEAQQTDLLSHIANKPVSSTPAETLLQPIVTVESIQEPTQYEQAPMPTPEGQVEAVSNTEIDISPITSELTSQTTILREIADNLKPSATEEGDMSPGEDAMKKVGGKDLSKDAGNFDSRYNGNIRLIFSVNRRYRYCETSIIYGIDCFIDCINGSSRSVQS